MRVGVPTRLRELARVGVALLVIGASGCGAGEEAPGKRTRPAVLVVFVDGVSGPEVAESWATELGPNARTSELYPVSTSLVAALESASTGLEPPEHGVLTAQDAAALHVVSDATRARIPDGDIVLDENVTNVRAVSELVWGRDSHVGSRSIEDVFERVRGSFDRSVVLPEVEELEGKTPEERTVVFRRDLVRVALDAPRLRAPWPEGLAAELEALERSADDPEPDDFDAWYSRARLASRSSELESAYLRAWNRSLGRQVAGVAEVLDARTTRWTVIVCGLRTEGLARGEVSLDESLPFAVLSNEPIDALPVELCDLASFVAERLGGDEAGDFERRSNGIWRAAELVGERGVWTSSDIGIASLVQPAVAGLRLRLGGEAPSIEVILHASADGDLLAAVSNDRIVAPDRQGRRLVLDLEPGTDWIVHTRTRSTRLMLELSSGGVAVDPCIVEVDERALGEVDLPRVIDDRCAELGESDLATRIAVERRPTGEIVIPLSSDLVRSVFEHDLLYDAVHRWNPSAEPGTFQVVDGVARAPFKGPGRIGIVLRLPGDGDQAPGRFAEASEFALDGRATSNDALRLLWPALVVEDERPERSRAPSNGLRLDVIGPTIIFEGIDAETRTFLSTLRDHE